MDGYDYDEMIYLATECSICGLRCEHTSGTYDVWVDDPTDDYTCVQTWYCNTCNLDLSEGDSSWGYKDHTYVNSVCSECGHECTHDDLGPEIYSNEDGTHWTREECHTCGFESEDIVTENCDLDSERLLR